MSVSLSGSAAGTLNMHSLFINIYNKYSAMMSLINERIQNMALEYTVAPKAHMLMIYWYHVHI